MLQLSNGTERLLGIYVVAQDLDSIKVQMVAKHGKPLQMVFPNQILVKRD